MKRTGVTLVELLIVVAIVALLTALLYAQDSDEYDSPKTRIYN